MFSGLLQDWLTTDGAGTTAFAQARPDWLDLEPFADVIFWLEVRAVSNPAAGNVVLSYETAPAVDESLFQPLGTVTLTASATPVITQVKLSASPPVPLGRYVRWKLAGTAAGNWSVTFRVFTMANRGTSGSGLFTPTSIPAIAAWYDSETNETPGNDNGAIDSIGDQSGNGNTISNTSPNRPAWTTGQFAGGTKHSIDTTGGTPDYLAATALVQSYHGYTAFATFKTTTVNTVSNQPNINPPMTLIGNTALAVRNNFGLNGQNVSYCYFSQISYGGWHEYVSAGLSLADGNRHTIAVTHSILPPLISLYADGVLVYSEATVAGDYSSVFTGFTALGIGCAVNDPFLGQIAEAMTWDSVATASDIAKLHARAVVLW